VLLVLLVLVLVLVRFVVVVWLLRGCGGLESGTACHTVGDWRGR